MNYLKKKKITDEQNFTAILSSKRKINYHKEVDKIIICKKTMQMYIQRKIYRLCSIYKILDLYILSVYFRLL